MGNMVGNDRVKRECCNADRDGHAHINADSDADAQANANAYAEAEAHSKTDADSETDSYPDGDSDPCRSLVLAFSKRPARAVSQPKIDRNYVQRCNRTLLALLQIEGLLKHKDLYRSK